MFGFQFERERNVFSRYFAGFDVWTAFEISRLIFAGGRLSQIIMSDISKAGVEFCTQRELKGADNQVQKYANAITPSYTENIHIRYALKKNDIIWEFFPNVGPPPPHPPPFGNPLSKKNF